MGYMAAVRCLRNAQTSFIHASPDITLTIPSTAQNVISVGAYDSQTNRTAAFPAEAIPGPLTA